MVSRVAVLGVYPLIVLDRLQSLEAIESGVQTEKKSQCLVRGQRLRSLECEELYQALEPSRWDPPDSHRQETS